MRSQFSGWTFPCGALLALALLASPGCARSGSSPGEEAPAPTTAAAASPGVGHDWPRFLGPDGDGKSAESLRLDWPAEGPPVVWFRSVGEGYSAPSVAEGRLFVFDRVGDTARLSAWDAATGEDLWSVGYPCTYEDLYQYSGGPRASPVIDGDRVYTHGVEGRLRAHRVDDGTLLWDVDTVADFGVVQNFFGAGSNPVIEGDLLLVMVGGSPADSPSISSGDVRGNGSGIVAFDKRTGEVRYRISDELSSYSTPVLVDQGGRRWGFAFTRGGLLTFEPGEGAIDFFFPWRAKKLESVNASTPVVVGDTVLISESYGPGSVLLRYADGEPEVLWKDPRRNQSLSLHWSTPIYHRGTVYASSGQSSGEAELRAVEHATGKVLWSEPGLGRSTLLYADDHFLVLTERGQLLLIEANAERYVEKARLDLSTGNDTSNAEAKKTLDGETDDQPRLRFPVWNAPVLSHGRLYLRGRDQIVVLDVAPVEAATSAQTTAAQTPEATSP